MRSGVTRLEVLIVLSICALLAGLLATGIQSLREDAAASRCTNNHKQFGLAFHSYHDTNNTIPLLVDQGPGSVTGKGLPSFFATLTPYLESTPYTFRPHENAERYHGHSSQLFEYRGKLGDKPWMSDGGIANKSWSIMICPSDASAFGLRDVPMTLPDGSTGYYSTGSYAMNGMLAGRKGAMHEIATRGSSNVILTGERPQLCTTAESDAVYNLWGVGFYSQHMPALAALTPTNPPGYWSTDLAAPVSPWPKESDAERESRLRFRVGWDDAEPEVLNPIPTFQLMRPSQPCDPRIPGTSHRAGMVVGMADGSVRTISKNVTPWVFWTEFRPMNEQ
jgi:type II secretory pathway pseudopilin PulG